MAYNERDHIKYLKIDRSRAACSCPVPFHKSQLILAKKTLSSIREQQLLVFRLKFLKVYIDLLFVLNTSLMQEAPGN